MLWIHKSWSSSLRIGLFVIHSKRRLISVFILLSIIVVSFTISTTDWFRMSFLEFALSLLSHSFKISYIPKAIILLAAYVSLIHNDLWSILSFVFQFKRWSLSSLCSFFKSLFWSCLAMLLFVCWVLFINIHPRCYSREWGIHEILNIVTTKIMNENTYSYLSLCYYCWIWTYLEDSYCNSSKRLSTSSSSVFKISGFLPISEGSCFISLAIFYTSLIKFFYFCLSTLPIGLSFKVSSLFLNF